MDICTAGIQGRYSRDIMEIQLGYNRDTAGIQWSYNREIMEIQLEYNGDAAGI